MDALPPVEALHRLEQRVTGAEAAGARSATELEEQQRLMLALTAAVQKAGQEAEAVRAGRLRQEELARQLEASLTRIQEVCAAVACVRTRGVQEGMRG